METAPSTRDMVTVKSGGKLLEAMVIATDGKLSSPFQIYFPIIANGPHGCFAAFQVFVIIVVVLKSFKTIACSQFLENEDNLNKEERAFVERNPGLFDPELVSAGKKRPNEDEDANASKKRKTSSDEVRLSLV